MGAAAKVLPFENALERPELGSYRKSFGPGEQLFRQGDEGNTLFVIVSGTVQLTAIRDEQELFISELATGHILGEKAIVGIKPHRRFFGARAKTDTVALEFTSEDFVTLEKKHPEIAIQILERICRVSVERLDRIDHLIKVLRPADNIERLVYMLIHFSHFEGTKRAEGVEVYLPMDTIRYYMAMIPFEIETCLNELNRLDILIPLGSSRYLLKNQAALIASMAQLKEVVPNLNAI